MNERYTISTISSTKNFIHRLQYLAQNDYKDIRDIHTLGIISNIYNWADWYEVSEDDKMQIQKLMDCILMRNSNLVLPIIISNSYYVNVNTPQTIYTWQRIYDTLPIDPELTPNYGQLYNWYALNGIRNIANVGWTVAYFDDFFDVKNEKDFSESGGDLKEIGTIHWNSPNTGATDIVNFKVLGAGYRDSDGSFSGAMTEARLGFKELDNNKNAHQLLYNSDTITEVDNVSEELAKTMGTSIRLRKISTNLSEGSFGTYLGNDGKVYPTVVINGIEWLRENLKETKYRTTQIVKYGYLYNGYVNIDTRNICPIGWHIPTYQEVLTYLMIYSGGMLKETGTTYWDSPNTGATNTLGFNGRGSGSTRNTEDLNQSGFFWIDLLDTDFSLYYFLLQYNYNPLIFDQGDATIKDGFAFRLVKDSTNLTIEGETGIMVGNDGRIYNTVLINGLEWMSENLCETKFRNGDLINKITNTTDWANTTESSYCAYNFDESNVLIEDGGDIAIVSDNIEWSTATSGARCYYNNDENNE